MRILFCLGLCAASLVPASAQTQESDDARYMRLETLVYAEGNTAAKRRINALSPVDRQFLTRYAATVSSDFVRCRSGGEGAQEACRRGENRARIRRDQRATSLPAPVSTTTSSVQPPVIDARRTAALETWTRLYPEVKRRAAGQPIDRFALWKTGDRPFLGEECSQLRRAADILGDDYRRRNPCPTVEQIRAAQDAQSARSASFAREQAAAIRETQRIEDARAASRRAAINGGNTSDLVTVRTYDSNGNYIGDRTMTRSQAETTGARPQ